jgi:8-oxo-dGTP diphosphatase
MRDVHVVTCFLLRRGEGGDEVLLLRRSERVGTYRGRWAGVSGYLEAQSPLEQAYREIEEEVGLARDGVRLLAEGEPLTVLDESVDTRWTVHPFLFELDRPERVRLDWEHTESRWVRPQEVPALETVPGLAEALARVYPGP